MDELHQWKNGRPINLSILDFKEFKRSDKEMEQISINLSILDFKVNRIVYDRLSEMPINLSILDFKGLTCLN